MISEVEEETGLLKNKKLSLQEAVEQIRSNVEDKTNEIKDLKEQIRKLDEQLELEMQETAREEEKWASEVESMDNHKKVLERKLNDGYDQALEQLKAAQQQYHLVVQETNEQRRTVVNNLYSVFTTATDHLSRVERFLDDQNKRMDRVYKKSLQEEEAELKELRDMVESYIAEDL